MLGSPNAGAGGASTEGADAREGLAGAPDSHELAPAGADGGAGDRPTGSGISDGGDAGGPAQTGASIRGAQLLRQLSQSVRGRAAGYEELRGAESAGSDGSTPTAAAAAAAPAPLSPSCPAASPAIDVASPRARGSEPLLRRAMGAAGAYAWRRRQLPRALSYRYCAGALLCIAVAYAAREADVRYGLWCMPRSWFQLHAVWHFMAAMVRACVAVSSASLPRQFICTAS